MSYKNHIAFFLMFLITISTACANSTHNLESNIGLYKIINKECEIKKNAFNPCKTTYFLEIVKGQFYGIKEGEISLVFWTGDYRIDPNLQYTSELIKIHEKTKLSGSKIWLTDNKTTQEYFVLVDNKLSRYVLIMKGKNKKIIRHIEYTLEPTIRSNMPHVKLNYPND
ncbi:MAG: hypothetical protein GY874_21955 [Desulfobacteraceae bacterium]|nr:hypothetical protein [Desulfobacteraceae bacterium]